MNYPRLVDGPTGNEVCMALARMILSPKREPARFKFVVDDGTKEQPNLVEREFAVCGFHDYVGGTDSGIALFLPITGPDAPEKSTKLIFYPTAQKGHIGHLEISDEKDESAE